jgi:hypothetical protein
VILTGFISSTLLRCPHHFILCAYIYLKISSPFMNFCSSFSIILYNEFVQISSLIFVSQKPRDYLCLVQTMSRIHMCVTNGLINVMWIFLALYLLVKLEVINTLHA